MLTTSPHLRTRRPTPTTVEYVVSTLPPVTIALRLLLLALVVFRILITLAVLSIVYSKFLNSPLSAPGKLYDGTPGFFSIDYMSFMVSLLTSSRVGELCSRIAVQTPFIILGPLSLATLYCCILRLHVTESVLVLRGLGIQTSTSSNTYLSTATTRFIPTEKIQDILVNEAFRGFEVRYYLVVVVEGEEDVVVVFPRLLPRRVIVENVWRGIRGCLFEPAEVVGKDKS